MGDCEATKKEKRMQKKEVERRGRRGQSQEGRGDCEEDLRERRRNRLRSFRVIEKRLSRCSRVEGWQCGGGGSDAGNGSRRHLFVTSDKLTRMRLGNELAKAELWTLGWVNHLRSGREKGRRRDYRDGAASVILNCDLSSKVSEVKSCDPEPSRITHLAPKCT